MARGGMTSRSLFPFGAGQALGRELSAVPTVTGNTVAAAGQFVPVDASGGTVTVTLPATPADGTLVAVKMVAVSGSNVVNISTAGPDVFNTGGGATTVALSLLNQGVLLLYAAAAKVWYVVADDLALSQLSVWYAKLMGWLVATDARWGADPYGANPKVALAAATAGQTVYFPPGTYTPPTGVGNGYTVVADGVTLRFGPGVTINVTTWGACGIDTIGHSDITITGRPTIAFTGTRGAMGSTYRGSATYVNTCGVYANRDRIRIDGLRTIGMVVGVFLSSWNGTGASDRVGVGNIIYDLECEGGDWGILWVGQKGLRINKLYVHDDYDDSGGVNPTHAYYCSANAVMHCTDLIISDAVAENILGGQAYQLKFCDNVRLSNHLANNCKGLFNGIDLTDTQVDGMGITGSRANGGLGSVVLQVVSNISRRVVMNNVSVTAAEGVDERLVRLYATDSEFTNFYVQPSRPASPTNPTDYEFIVTGDNCRYRNVTIRSRGAGHVRAFEFSGVCNNSALEDFVTESTIGFVDVGGGSTGISIRYNPAAQLSTITGSLYVGTIGGAASYTVSRSEHERQITVASGATTPRPNPFTETRAHLNVTDSSNFTIVNPLGGNPNVGTTLEIVVTNSSGGALGTVTWDTAYTLLAAYMKPANGLSTFHRFWFNGTTWVETPFAPGTQPSYTVTGLTGATTQSRYVGGTVAGAPASGTFQATDHVISQDGNVYICTVGGTPGTWVAVGTPPALTAFAADALSVGEIVPARNRITTNAVAPVSGQLSLVYFTADKTEAINTLTAFTGGTAAGATPTLVRYGIYSVDGSGNLTLIGATPNDTTLLAATNTAYPKGLSSTFSKVAGVRYAVGLLVVTAATMPTFHGLQLTGTNPVNSLVRLAPAIVGRLVSQTDLPESVTAASLVGWQAMVAMQLS